MLKRRSKMQEQKNHDEYVVDCLNEIVELGLSEFTKNMGERALFANKAGREQIKKDVDDCTAAVNEALDFLGNYILDGTKVKV
jgi:hypothetical protein